MSRTTRYIVVVLLAGLLTSCDSSTTPAGPTPSPVPTQTQAPAANPVPAPEPSPAPTPTFTYSGIVTDGTGRPVVGATVRGGPNSASTDANGRYEFRSPYSSVPGNVYPPAGYERKPVYTYQSFNLLPVGQNISIRRITSVSMSPPTTLKVGERGSMSPRISFDTGQVESPVFDYFERSVSDSAVLKFLGVENALIEAIKPGTASVTGSYFGVSAGSAQIQVVP